MVRQQVTRAEIVQAAWALAADEGEPAITMRRIGEETGVAAMTLYNHIDGRDDVLDAIADRFWTTAAELAADRGDAPFVDWLRCLVEEVAALGSRVPALAGLVVGRIPGEALRSIQHEFFARGERDVDADALRTLWHGVVSLLAGRLCLGAASVGPAGVLIRASPDPSGRAAQAGRAEPDGELLAAVGWLVEGALG